MENGPLTQKPQSIALLRRNLVHVLHLGQLEDAENLLHQLRTIDPISKETRCFELEILLKKRVLTQTVRLATALVEHFPDSSRVLWLAGQSHFHCKDYGAALPLFQESLRLNFRPITQWWLGRTLLRLGKLIDARTELENITEKIPRALLDIAWLEEREGNFRASFKTIEKYLQLHPEDAFAKKGLARVKAFLLDSGSLSDEIESLRQWGERPPDHLVPIYLTKLLEAGEGAKARQYVVDNRLNLGQSTEIAWIFYKAQAYDVAYDLFRQNLNDNLARTPFLSAFETAADKCARLNEVIEKYKELAPATKNLYGRIIRLRKKIDHTTRATKSLLKYPRE